jgi:DNA-directed RNA polymerase specialized sigma24 family protein
MIQREFEADDLSERCREAVARVLKRYDWRLLDGEELALRAAACVRVGEITDPGKAAVHVYCACLYAACRGDEGPARQERAFIELQRYLYDLSFREVFTLPPDIRLEQINETLLRIWRRLPAYYKPGAFLAVAAMELRNVMRPWWTRPSSGRERRPWEQPPTSIEASSQEIAGESDDAPLQQALSEELSRQVRACFDEALRRNPRARQQLEAVWLKYIAGFDDATIGRYLEKPVTSIHVLRSRGIKRLRAEPCWQQLAQDLGL